MFNCFYLAVPAVSFVRRGTAGVGSMSPATCSWSQDKERSCSRSWLSRYFRVEIEIWTRQAGRAGSVKVTEKGEDHEEIGEFF